MAYKFSNKSLGKLELADPDFQILFPQVLRHSPIDFGISHSYRSPEEQFELFKKGRQEMDGIWTPFPGGKIVTTLDGHKKKSKHNFKPSKAVDIYCWPRKIMYDETHLAVVGGLVLATAARLYEQGLMKHRIRWGNNWDGDGVLVAKDETERFVDAPHFELIE